jgi:hypothetical protein
MLASCSLLAAASIITIPAVSGSAATLETRIFSFSYDGPGGNVMEYHASVQAAPGAFAAFAEVVDPASKSPTVSGDIVDLDQFEAVRTFGPLGSSDVCPGTAILCATASSDGSAVITGGAAAFTDPSKVIHLREYVIIRGVSVRFSFDRGRGWRKRSTEQAAVRVLDSQAGDLGAAALGDEVSLHTGTRAQGYAHGSLALAAAPCEVAGTGSLTLIGGMSHASASCEAPVAGSLARGPTKWATAGNVVGVTRYATRLLVIPA